MRLIYGCIAYVQDKAHMGFGFISRLITWLRPRSIEIVAIEAPAGNKRRAVEREDLPSCLQTPSMILTPPDSRPSSSQEDDAMEMPQDKPQQESHEAPQAESHVQAYAKSQQDSHAQPQQESLAEPQQESLAEPQQDSLAKTQQEPLAEPQQDSSSELQQTSAAEPQETSPAETQEESPAAPQEEALEEPQQLLQPQPPKHEAPSHKGMARLTLKDWVQDAPMRLQQRVQPIISPAAPPPPPPMQRITLPLDARPQATSSKQHEEERDVEINSLIARSRKAMVVSPDVEALRASFRRTKLKEQVEAAEQEQVEQEAALQAQAQHEAKEAAIQAEREAEEAAIQAQLEQEAQQKAEQEAEEIRRKAEEAEETSRKAEEAAKVDKSKLIRPLDPEWDTKVKLAMEAKNERHVLATSTEGVGLTRHDFGSLLPLPGQTEATSWLNDEIVNAWFSAIVERKAQETGYTKAKGAKLTPAIAAFQSAWYTTYKSKGMAGIGRWSRRMGIKGDKLLHADKIFFPINTGAHWMLLIISPKTKTIEYLDSLGQTGKQFFKIAREWLEMELGPKLYKAEEWTQSRSKSSCQLNTDDCGAFTCLNGLAAAKGYEFSDVQAGKMQEARRMMGAVLLNGGFSGDWQL